MELQDALTQIAHIRKQMARVEWYRGYRAMPVAFSGFLALAVATWQAIILPNPCEHVDSYLTLWIGTAAVSATVAGIGMALRYRETGALTRLAIEQFLPCVVAGGLVTLVLVATMPEAVALLPGLWAVIFSLGVFLPLVGCCRGPSVGSACITWFPAWLAWHWREDRRRCRRGPWPYRLAAANS